MRAAGTLPPIVLDTGPLGRLANPNAQAPATVEITTWMRAHLAAVTPVIIPEVTDYELRRELLRAGLVLGVARLDALATECSYLEIDTWAVRQAAAFWAQARNQGTPTADPKELDVDVILAAQALQVSGRVATENIGHLSLFVPADMWRSLRPGS